MVSHCKPLELEPSQVHMGICNFISSEAGEQWRWRSRDWVGKGAQDWLIDGLGKECQD